MNVRTTNYQLHLAEYSKWLLRLCEKLGQTEPDAELAEKNRQGKNATDKTYGYRRVRKWLLDRNIQRNPKAVLRIMKKYGLLSEIRRRRKWVNLGQEVYKYENLLNRQFRADGQNTKWVTDISYIHPRKAFCICP